jgi:hypothetical protein
MTIPGTTTPGKAENSWQFTAAPPGGDHVPARSVVAVVDTEADEELRSNLGSIEQEYKSSSPADPG